jgi:hypothetical protein
LIKLPTEKPAVFARFVYWIYHRSLDMDGVKQQYFNSLAELWVLADMREAPLLMNCILSEMGTLVVDKWIVPMSNLTYAYENTSDEAGLRRFMGDIITLTAEPELLTKEENYSKTALWDILKIVWGMDKSKKLSRDQVKDIDMCKYHHHEAGTQCTGEGCKRIAVAAEK